MALDTVEVGAELRERGSILPGVWVWVWEPPSAPGNALDLFSGAFVRAANGNGVIAGDSGFDFAASYKRWAKQFGPERCAAWTWVYESSDGVASAKALAGAAPSAPAYLLDVEAAVSAATVAAFCSTLRSLKPGVPIGFTSYPTRKQATTFGVPWDALVEHCDFGAPQVYFASQASKLEQVYLDHKGKPVHLAVWPDANQEPWQGWVEGARDAVRRWGGVSVWLHPVARKWDEGLRAIAAEVSYPSMLELTVLLSELDLRTATKKTPLVHPLVRQLQGLLAADGRLDPSAHPIDGVGDAVTKRGVVRFQKAHGLEPDAVVGARTWTELLR